MISRKTITLLLIQNYRALKRWYDSERSFLEYQSGFLVTFQWLRHWKWLRMCSISLNVHLSKYEAIKTDIRVFKDIYRIENKYEGKKLLL